MVGVIVEITGAKVGVLVGVLTGAVAVAVTTGVLTACAVWHAASSTTIKSIDNPGSNRRNMIILRDFTTYP
jgi:hypothetical protein